MSKIPQQRAQRNTGDFAAITRLHEVGLCCAQPGNEFHDCLNAIVEAAIAITAAGKGNMQLFDPESGALRIVAQQGFDQPFLDFFTSVGGDDASACGAALQGARRVLVEDVSQSEIFAGQPSLKVLREAGVRAVQSFPLLSSTGNVLGMISTHHSQPHCSGERELQLMDLLARQAADYLDRKQAEKALNSSEERYRVLANLLPAAVYICDITGLITFYNPQAAHLWGRAPKLGDTDERFCGSDQLILPDGRILPHDQCPMAVALREGTSFRDELVIIRRPDGSRISVRVNIDPIRNEFGRIVGAINLFHDMTSLYDVEQAPRENERRFRQMIDALPTAIYTTDAKGRITHFNPACVKFSGRAPELGSDCWCISWKLFHPDGRPMPHDECPMAIALKEGRVIQGTEAIAERPDGTRIWFTPYPTPLFDYAGNIIGGINMLLDITQRKHAEEVLLIRTKQQLAVAKIGEFALERDDLQEIFDYVSATMAETLDVEYCKVLELLPGGKEVLLRAGVGWHPGLVGHATISTVATQAGFTLASDAPVLVLDLRQEQRFDGPAWLFDHGVISGMSCIIRHPDGRPWGVLGTHAKRHMDFTEDDISFQSAVANILGNAIDRTSALKALRESEERFRMLADNMSQFAWTCDDFGNVTWYNQRWLDYTGLSFEEMSNWGWTKVHHPDHLDRVVASVKRSRESGEIWEETFPLRGKDGQYRWFLSRALPIRDEQGSIVRWFGTNTDITKQLEAEKELVQLAESLEAQVALRTGELQEQAVRLRILANELTWAEQRERKRLAALLHDDLQQSLVAAKMGLSSLSMTVAHNGIGDEVRRLLEIVDTAITSSRNLTRELLPLGLFEASLGAALEWLAVKTKQLYKLNVYMSGGELGQAVDDDAKALLYECVRELLLNTVKHAAASKVFIRLQEDDNELNLAVEDDGRGFDPVKALRLGRDEAFGLFSIRERLAAIAGTMTIYSQPGFGTRVELTVPIVAMREKTDADSTDALFVPDSTEAAIHHERTGESQLRILVVDDHPVVRQGIAEVLNSDPHLLVVAQAGDGIEALEGIEQWLPEIVLLDVNMPRMNGIETAREIRRRWPEILIFGFSVNDDAATIKAMTDAGTVEFIPKASNPAEIISRILNHSQSCGLSN